MTPEHSHGEVKTERVPERVIILLGLCQLGNAVEHRESPASGQQRACMRALGHATRAKNFHGHIFANVLYLNHTPTLA